MVFSEAASDNQSNRLLKRVSRSIIFQATYGLTTASFILYINALKSHAMHTFYFITNLSSQHNTNYFTRGFLSI